jgi:hypothetical protein
MKNTTKADRVGIFARTFVALSVVVSVASAAGCGSSPAHSTTPSTAATLISIAVTPANPSIAVGATEPFAAIGTYSDQSTKDLSATATWTSATTSTATIASGGLATAVAMGSTVITATSGTVSGTTTLTVTAPTPTPTATLVSIAVAPNSPSIGTGGTQQFSATGTFNDGTTKDVSPTVTWASATTATATISSAGVATAVAMGTTVISATSGSISGMTTLTVTAPPVLMSISVTPATPSIAKGTNQQFTATGTYSDTSTKDLTATATWASATPATATITTGGLATGVVGGTTVISATSGGVSGMTTLTVTGAALVSIAVTPGAPSIAAGTKQQFVATGTFKDAANVMTTQDLSAMVTWASVTAATATITPAGLATGLVVGTSVITATSGTGATAIVGMTTLNVTAATLMSIAVTTSTPSIAKGATATFVATGTFTDTSTQVLTTQVTWASATPGTATIAATGIATSVGVGTTVISAKLTTGTGATAVTVTGMLTLTVTDAVLVSIAVSEEVPTGSPQGQMAKNTTVQLDAIGTYSDSTTHDLTTTVVWGSSAGNVTVSGANGTEGLATANGNAGPSTISAKLTTGTGATAVTVTGTLVMTVTNVTLQSIVVTPATPAIAAGTTLQFAATGFFSDASKQFVTESAAWKSAMETTATVLNTAGSKGLATGHVLGTSVITASVGAINDTATLTVSAAVLQSIAIGPSATPNVALGTTLQLSAEGSYSDGSKQDLTSTVHWDSATGGIATISNAANPGKVTPVAKGTSVISASFTPPGGVKVTGTATLTVSDAVLDTIAVTAAGATTIEKGATLQLTATGTFTAGAPVDLTKMVTWGSDKMGVATVSNVAATAGLVTATGTGTAVITATSTAPSSTGHPVPGTLTITVNNGVLKSIEVTPATPSIAFGTKLQFVAMGTYDDTAKLDITSSVNWASDTTATATFDNVAGDEGVAAGVAPGTAKITASQGTIAGNTMLTVTPATLRSIVLKPLTASIAKGTSVQFTATGFFSDTSTQDLTDTATWASSVMATATISNFPISNGLATGVAQAVAPTNITASVIINNVTVTSPPTPLIVTAQTLASIAITPATANLPKGSTLNFVATGTFSDSSTQDLTNTVAWAPATGATATVSNANNQHGRATGVAPGTVDVTATIAGTPVAHASLTVTAAIASIAVTPATPTIAKTLTQQFTALATLSDTTTLDVSSFATWVSGTKATATISPTGLATGVAAGTSKITAASGGITSPQVLLTVTN